MYMNERQVLGEIGSRIKRFRADKHLTQSQLADLCRFEKAAMSRIESGKINLTILTLQKISSAMNIPIGSLLQD